MKVGIVQFAPVLGEPRSSIERLESTLSGMDQVDLLVVPELSNSGYKFVSQQQAREAAETIGEGLFSDYIRRKSRELNCHIVAGMNERAGDRLYNSAILAGPEGIIGKYRKMHLYLNEPDFFEPGDTAPTVHDVNGVKVSILICFDWAFPEVWRMAALAGAQVICHPSNIVTPQRALTGLGGHALCNRVFIVTANRIGTEGDLTFGGMSTVISPSGGIIAQAVPDGTAVVVAEIDTSKALDKNLTHRNHVLNDRRPEMYRSLVENRGEE